MGKLIKKIKFFEGGACAYSLNRPLETSEDVEQLEKELEEQ